jgi:hypothetical protein
MDNLIYEDNFSRIFSFEVWIRDIVYRLHIRLVIYLIVAALFVTLIQIEEGALFFIAIIAAALLILIFLIAIFPAKYQIFDDRIRIVLGTLLFHRDIDIPFNNIENTKEAKWKDLWGLNLNLISAYSSDDILQIIRKHGAKININPTNRKVFLEYLNKALAEWRRSSR